MISHLREGVKTLADQENVKWVTNKMLPPPRLVFAYLFEWFLFICLNGFNIRVSIIRLWCN